MARRVFFSFHHARDVWRAGQVRNSWVKSPPSFCHGEKIWFFSKRGLTVTYCWDSYPHVLPHRGARSRALKCAGQPKAAPEMRRLAFGVSPGQYSGGADAVAVTGATQHSIRRPKPCGPGARSRAPLRTNGRPCASGAITPAGPCRGTGICPASGG